MKYYIDSTDIVRCDDTTGKWIIVGWARSTIRDMVFTLNDTSKKRIASYKPIPSLLAALRGYYDEELHVAEILP